MSVLNELVIAATALLKEETHVAQTSYRQWDGKVWVWNDEVWERNAPEHFGRVKALRAAIQAVDEERQGTPHYTFLVRRPVDSQAWPLIFTDAERAAKSPHRVSDITIVHLKEKGPP